MLQLVDDGLIELDEPIGRWFPDMPDGAAITVRMLGDMSSGIDYSMDATLSEEYLMAPTKVWAPEELAAAGIALPRKFPPGEGFLYSNTNFVMLGLIIEDVTGKPFGEVLDERILQPLGMTSTTFPDTSERPDPWWHGTTDQGVAGGAAPVDASLEPVVRMGGRSGHLDRRGPARCGAGTGRRHTPRASDPAGAPRAQPGVGQRGAPVRLRPHRPAGLAAPRR